MRKKKFLIYFLFFPIQVKLKYNIPFLKKPILVVVRDKEVSTVPIIGSIVLCKVTRINPRMANVKIICSDDKVLKDGFLGIIR